MKTKYFLIVIPLLINILIFNSCDSASDSVATTVTAPTLVSPADNATGVSRNPTFTWTGEADKLEVATNNNFNPAVHSTTVSGTSYQLTAITLDQQQTYFWRVGKTSNNTVYWSTVNFRFTTGN